MASGSLCSRRGLIPVRLTSNADISLASDLTWLVTTPEGVTANRQATLTRCNVACSLWLNNHQDLCRTHGARNVKEATF